MHTLTRSDRTALEALSARTTLPVLSRIAVQVAWHYLLWTQRRKSRLKLKELDNHMLRDIGMSPRDAFDEARKPFWRP